MSLMRINPLADLSDARIIGPPRCRGQRIFAAGYSSDRGGCDDLYLRQARLGIAATGQPATAVPARRRLPPVAWAPARRAAGRPLRDRFPAAGGRADRPCYDAGARTAVSAATQAAGTDRRDPGARRCRRSGDVALLWRDGVQQLDCQSPRRYRAGPP